MKLSQKILLWVKALRAPFFSATIMSAVIASLIAYKDGHFSWLYLISSMAIIAAANGGINLTNDYFDLKTDNINRYYTPLSGGSRVIQEGLIKHRKVLAGAIACFLVAIAIGLFFVIRVDINLLWFGLGGIVLGYFYTAPPFKFVYRGIGEIMVFLLVGPLSVCGTYYLFTQSFSLEALLLSLPYGISTANILFINEFPDYGADRKAGKKQLVVMLGRKKSRHLYFMLISATYLAIIIPVLLRLISPFLLVTLLSVPIATKAIIVTYQHYNDEKKILPAQANTIILTLALGILICIGIALEKFFHLL